MPEAPPQGRQGRAPALLHGEARGGDRTMATTTAGPADAGAALRRGGRPPRRLWQVPTFFAGLLALASVYAGRPLWHSTEAEQLARDLAAVRRAVRQPRGQPERVLALAESLLARSEDRPDAA